MVQLGYFVLHLLFTSAVFRRLYRCWLMMLLVLSYDASEDSDADSDVLDGQELA